MDGQTHIAPGFERNWKEVSATTPLVQDKHELLALQSIIKELGCRDYLEVGASNGISFYVLGMAMRMYSSLSFVDLGEEKLMKARCELLEDNSYRINKFIGDSTSPVTVDDVRQNHPNGFDVVLIDAKHTYDYVKRDYENYGSMANKLLVFHDIGIPDVRQVWEETGGGLEIMNPSNKNKAGFNMGFGVRWVK